MKLKKVKERGERGKATVKETEIKDTRKDKAHIL
jgi:hypothetical protein